MGLHRENFSLNICILHGLRNKLLHLILISIDSAFWELYKYLRRICVPMKILEMTPASGIELRLRLRGRPTSHPWTPQNFRNLRLQILYVLRLQILYVAISSRSLPREPKFILILGFNLTPPQGLQVLRGVMLRKL